MPSLQPHLDQATGTVRFWVSVSGRAVQASVSRALLHEHFHRESLSDQPLATYLAHAEGMANAVRRRVAVGAVEPVVLREFDLAALAPG